MDILVELAEPRYELLSQLWSFLERVLKRKVDMVRKGPHLRKQLLGSIENDILYV